MRFPTLVRPISRLLVAFLCVAGLVACADDGRSPVEAGDEETVVVSSSDCVPTVLDEILIGLIQGLRGEVEILASADLINQGQTGALSRHLDNADRQLAKGEYCAVQDQLTAFREQVEELVGDGFLSDRDAFELMLQSRMALGPTGVDPKTEAYAPGATGELRTVQIGGDQITYEVIDGLALLNSDMILGYADEFEAAVASGASAAGGPQRTTPCVNTELSCARWPDGVIGYQMRLDWGARTEMVVGWIQDAISHWEGMTGMNFEFRTEGPRVIFRNGSGCSSWIGRNPFAIFDPQYIFIDPTSCGAGSVIHEIGHAVGLHHEQNRRLRDIDVTVNFDVIPDDVEYNFHECLALCVAAGGTLSGYDFGSIMHYACDTFKEEGATKNPIEPKHGQTCEGVGQRNALSEADIMGAYYLYRPEFEITGASDGDVWDRFVLHTDFSTEPVADEYIVWTVDGEEQGTGPTLSTLDLALEPGTYAISAAVKIATEVLVTRSLTLTIANDAPVVSLGPDHAVDMNRVFTVTADVTDTEDGSCLPPACSYEWDPAPQSQTGAAATYLFPSEGIVGITVTVTDGFGDTGSDEVVVTVVDSPPEPLITAPAAGSFSAGGTTTYEGSATDANHGPGPGDGTLPCASLTWSSSDPSDALSVANGCGGTITFGDPGVRTLTLEADDGTGNTASTSVSIEVDGCEGGCAPDISFVFDTPPDLDGSQYDPPFTEPGYLLSTTIHMTASIADADGPGTGIALEWWVQPPCLAPGGGCDDFQIGTDGVFAPNNAFLSWTPSDDVAEWSNCALTPLPFIISLHATDGNGNTRVYSRTVYLGCVFG